MTIVSRGGALGRTGLRWWARFTAQLDIFRLMTCGLARNRRMVSRRSISAVASVMALARRSGGKGRLVGDLAADHSERGGEGGPVWVELFFLGCSVDEGSDR
jgi:hypothetical protein